MIQKLRKQIVQMAYDAGEGHIPSALSILDIVWTLYDKILTPNDRFILSKGHGCLALYVVLAAKGFIAQEQLATFAKHDSILGGHPDRNKVPGVLCSTGSLGHGFPQAVGIALAKKIKKESGRVFCLIGDGECNEGSIWEAAMLASNHRLTNLTVIVDHNHSTDRALYLGNLHDKFEAFGFRARTSGYIGTPTYDMSSSMFAEDNLFPTALVMHTIKGYGCARMQHNSWHRRAPNKQELAEILQELSCENNS
jgi:transketolase